MQNLLLISGSLRETSMNTGLLRALSEEAPEGIDVSWADLRLPLYDQDEESDFPASAAKLRKAILAADAIAIATPEYNRGMSGVLKNAIDWASRPYGENAWAGKRVLVASASPGSIGGALAVYQVKQSLLHLDAEILGQPEVMVGGAAEKFDEGGRLVDDRTREFLRQAINRLLSA